MFCYTLRYVHSSIAIILMGKRELVALLSLPSWCLLMVGGSSAWCRWVVCGLWLWYFLIILTCCFCVFYAFVRICLYVPCGHLLGKGWPLGSRLWCITVSLLLSLLYPGLGVVLDCIDSWSLHLYACVRACVCVCVCVIIVLLVPYFCFAVFAHICTSSYSQFFVIFSQIIKNTQQKYKLIIINYKYWS